MTRYLPFLFLFFLVISCRSAKDLGQSSEGSISVVGMIKKHHPYCGGAKPPPQVEKGYLSPLANQTFYIKRGVVNHDTLEIVNQIFTGSKGQFNCNLDIGTYALIFPEKNETFQKFYKQAKVETRFLKAADVDCFLRWWRAPEAIFQVSDTSSNIQCIVQHTCDAGFNPCLTYVGPKRK